jgi:hypothetical protein
LHFSAPAPVFLCSGKKTLRSNNRLYFGKPNSAFDGYLRLKIKKEKEEFYSSLLFKQISTATSTKFVANSTPEVMVIKVPVEVLAAVEAALLAGSTKD